jgi:pimeloyl-ACP methyl ester carboxylesterase
MRRNKGYGMIMIFILLSLLIASTSFAGNPPSNYYVDETKLPFDALPGTDTIRYWGVHGGAGYRIEVPKNWNGELVLYCHGYRGYIPELTVSDPSIRKYLVDNGYAWAASSYRTNGYDVKTGVMDTHALAKFFNGLVGKPKRTYIIGHSMGGHITGVAIEQYPKAFDGALPMCGVMGDSELFDYFFDYHAVAQWLTETNTGFPFPPNYTTVTIPEMKAELGGTGFPITLTPDGVKLRTATKYISGGERPLFNTAFMYWGNFLFTVGLDGTLGGVVPGNIMGNMDMVYQLDDDPVLSNEELLLNAEVLRIAPDPQGRHPNGLANVPSISGNINIPVLTLHTVSDLFVPFLMEQIYAERVASQGKSGLLVQRIIRDIGHCAFTNAEQEKAFEDLVKWVKTGAKPAGDDVLTPSVIADTKYGCQFTPVRHSPYDPLPWACTSP